MSLKTCVVAMTLLSASLAAHAATLNVNEIGVFSATTPITAYSAPGAVYSLNFNVSSTPAVSNVSAGSYFNPSFSNFTYTLNGVSSATTAASVTVYNQSNSGLFSVCFTALCTGSTISGPGLEFFGPQIYSGAEASPTILTGAYTPSTTNQPAFFNGRNTYTLALATPVVISAVPNASAPEISASGLSSGLVLLSGAILILREKKRFRTAPLA